MRLDKEEIRKALEDAELKQPIRDEDGYYTIFTASGLIAARLFRTEVVHLFSNAPTWLRTLLEELAEKDKVLEWYEDAMKTELWDDGGEKARSILSQYKEETHVKP